MSEATRILSAIEQGDPTAAEQLLPLVYDELRKLAAAKLAQERPGQTLDPTALVHEAYLRLVGNDPVDSPRWDGRGHFFAAAAEAMRRILIDSARRKKAEKHGGEHQRVELADVFFARPASADDLLSLDEALAELAREDAAAAEMARLRLFAGLSPEQAAEVMGVSRATGFRHWAYARAWLSDRLRDDSGP
jgi:RNA polymerase sigma factor (TIGR02999 family)